ncbi:MAG: DUF4388 domain-containing protein [Myxococcales bacterium]|nr:DUF4388 domain-containing protein [Myxococcales bacterium]
MAEGPAQKPSQSRLGAIPGGRAFGPWLLVERLAIGGTADVFLGRRVDAAPDAPLVVVKRLLPSLRHDATARESFVEEAALHAKVVHPNVVRCLESGEVDGEPSLALEHIAGVDLHRVLAIGQARRRPRAAARRVPRARDAGRARRRARRGDRPPRRALQRVPGPARRGEARRLRHRQVGAARAAAIRGKYAYLAPEQVASEAVDHRADLFAVANVLCEMMLARPLFPGSGQLAVLLAIRDVRIDALEQPSAIPPALVTVLRRALARAPEARFPDAAAFDAALGPWAWQEEVTARREIEKLVRWTRDASTELRAVGEHPDQKAPLLSLAPPSSVPISRLATPVQPIPSLSMPRPALELDSDAFHVPARDPASFVEPKPTVVAASTAPFTPIPSRVRTTDGRLLGPFAYAKLVELVATGKLGGADEVDFMGTGFVALADIDELARHLAPRSTVTRQLEGPGTPDWHGVVQEPSDDTTLPTSTSLDPGVARALSFVATRRATGVLIAQEPRRRKEIYFVNGRMFHAATSESSELTGEYLVARGLLDRSDLDFALAVLPRFDGRLGEALTTLGLVEPVKMFRLLEDLNRDRLLDLFRWTEGELSFYDGAQPGKVDFPLDLLIGPIVESGVGGVLSDAEAEGRASRWGKRRIQPAEATSGLHDAGWSAVVLHTLVCTRGGVGYGSLVSALCHDGLRPAAAVRAIETARLARLLEWA